MFAAETGLLSEQFFHMNWTHRYWCLCPSSKTVKQLVMLPIFLFLLVVKSSELQLTAC